MKKILICILTLICVIAFTATAEEPFLKFEFSCDAGEKLQNGDTVVCRAKYTDINDKGLSSVEFAVAFSDGLRFNNDAAATGLENGWVLWNPNVGDGSVRFAAVDETVVMAGKKDIEITFSFTVISDSISNEYVQLVENYAYDFDMNEVTDFTSSLSHNPFWVGLPKVSVENAGASLRINKTPALRFGLKYEALPEDARAGVLVCESDKLEGELNHSTASSKELFSDNKIKDGFYSTDALEITSNTEKYTFRPFVMLETSDGGEYYMYFEPLERSAADIAASELAVESDEEVQEILKGFISGT